MKQLLTHGGDRSALLRPQPRITRSRWFTHHQAPPHTCPSGPRSFWLVARSEWVLPGASASGSSLVRLLPRAGWRQQHRPCPEKPWFSPQGCHHGASSVTISSALPLWKNGSIEALKPTSSSESTVEFKQKCLRSLRRDGTQVLGSTHPRLQPRQIHHPPLRLMERRCNPAQLFTEEVPGEEMPSDQQIPTGGCSHRPHLEVMCLLPASLHCTRDK